MRADEIREGFLDFFREKGHVVVPSDSLLPSADPTLLFTNAGMNQFKDIFLGLDERGYRRAVNSQKCMRVSGKHNDLEDVGRDTYHHTFFEMLGNWSFGDYYKAEAIGWAWELLTERWKIPAERLWVTVFRDDDEAAGLWPKVTSIPGERVLRFDEKENFWAMGPKGPCGPCSEIHVDLGPGACTMTGDPRHSCGPNAECGRFVELWNLVFIQFDRSGDGKLGDLPAKHIDTGLGFERLVAVLQGKLSNYDTDLFLPIMETLSGLCGKGYNEDKVAFRVVADHVRALTFAVTDGIMPSNEGRGYVLRMILRRAYRFGCRLGMKEPFLYKLVPTVARIMAAQYPELEDAREHVSKVVLNEEERFRATLANGLEILGEIISGLKNKGEKRIHGGDAFKLYDTYGFPVDLIREIAHENGVDIDEDGFTRLMGEQRDRARASWKGRAKEAEVDVYRDIRRDVGETVSMAHDTTTDVRSKVVALLVEGCLVEEAGEGKNVEVVLGKTPFYAEGGGQVGDRGKISGEGVRVDVEDTVAPVEGLVVHRGKVLNGTLRRGMAVEVSVNAERRDEIARNHTATHLLQAALRQVLGNHIKQSGSLVEADRLRFDFTHYQAVGDRELERVEEIVNSGIMKDLEVRTMVVPYRDVKGSGVIAPFGEKYGDEVRVIEIAGCSKELCGGTHVTSSGKIGFFKIIGERAVAAGIRRIEAVSGRHAWSYTREMEDRMRALAGLLKTSPSDVVERVRKLLDEKKAKEKKKNGEALKSAVDEAKDIVERAKDINGIKVATRQVGGADVPHLRAIVDGIKGKQKKFVVALFTTQGEKAVAVVGVTKDIAGKTIDAGLLARAIAPIIGGRGGGGRPDMAQAGGKDPSKIREAIGRVPSMVKKILEEK